MNNLIFINPNINNCQMYSTGSAVTDSLESLINLSEDKSKLFFILSKQCCYSDYLDIPKKNKSLFKKNAKKIILQDLNYSSNEFIVINKEYKGRLPYYIINEDFIISILDIFKKHKLQNNLLYFETSFLSSDQDEWKFLIKDNDEINIYYNGSLFTSQSSSLSDDVSVLFTQNKNPESLNFYSLNKNNSNQDEIQFLQSEKIANITYTSILDDLSSIDQRNSISLKQLLKLNKKKSVGILSSWKSLSFAFFSLLVTIASINNYQNLSLDSQQLKMRTVNLVEYIFKDGQSLFDETDLEIIISSIKNSNNLPTVSHINSLNYLGNIFGISDIQVDQLNIMQDNSIYLKLHTTKKASIGRINDALQTNDYFLTEIRSLQNISDEKTQMEINLILKEQY